MSNQSTQSNINLSNMVELKQALENVDELMNIDFSYHILGTSWALVIYGSKYIFMKQKSFIVDSFSP